jgi:hypothetical protein
MTPGIVSTDTSTSSQTSRQGRRSPAGNNPSKRSQKIVSLDIKTLDGALVTVMESGTPAQFYCKLVTTYPKMEKVLLDVE